jgi:CPA2 family monovalent cation:H+ antiporter-2
MVGIAAFPVAPHADLDSHIKELLDVRRVALPGALGQSLVATMLGTLVGVSCGWGWSAGIVFGLAISVASTVVLMRVLVDNGDLYTPTGHIAVGWLVAEDLFTVLVLVLLPAIFRRDEAGAGEVALALGLAMLEVGAMVALTFVLGERLIPWVLDRAAGTRSRELFVLTVLPSDRLPRIGPPAIHQGTDPLRCPDPSRGRG